MHTKQFVAIALILSTGIAFGTGCKFQASAKIGGKDEPSAAPAPSTATPPAATTAAPPAPTPTPAPKPAPAPTPTPAPTAAKANVKVVAGKKVVAGNIVFQNDSDTLDPASGSEATLAQVKLWLDQTPRCTKLRIDGHTDNTGDAAKNLDLSDRRALAVKKWLLAKGVDAKRLAAVGFGQTTPIADNSTDSGKAQNRRIEFTIFELDGKPNGSSDLTDGGKGKSVE